MHRKDFLNSARRILSRTRELYHFSKPAGAKTPARFPRRDASPKLKSENFYFCRAAGEIAGNVRVPPDQVLRTVRPELKRAASPSARARSKRVAVRLATARAMDVPSNMRIRFAAKSSAHDF